MNLDEMARFVCGKVRQTDANALEACKGFLRQREEMIWNEGLWRCSLYQVNVAVDPAGNELHGVGVVELPRVTDRVLAVRMDDRALRVEQEEMFFRQDFDGFEASGEPTSYFLLPAAVWRGVGGRTVRVVALSGSSDGSSVLSWVDGNGEVYSREVGNVGGDGGLLGDDVVCVLGWSKPPTTGAVELVDGAGVVLARLEGDETVFVPRQGIRLMERPVRGLVLRVLVKRKHQRMGGDYAVSEIPNVENCLMAFAMADMLERGRQYGKASAKVTEAAALLEQLKGIESLQQANSIRLVPEPYEGGGEFLPGKGYW